MGLAQNKAKGSLPCVVAKIGELTHETGKQMTHERPVSSEPQEGKRPDFTQNQETAVRNREVEPVVNKVFWVVQTQSLGRRECGMF